MQSQGSTIGLSVVTMHPISGIEKATMSAAIAAVAIAEDILTHSPDIWKVRSVVNGLAALDTRTQCLPTSHNILGELSH